MKKWMPLDQFGDCNAEVCADDEKCYDSMEDKYKFYLSFENSLCQDYVTEKFWNFLGKTIKFFQLTGFKVVVELVSK